MLLLLSVCHAIITEAFFVRVNSNDFINVEALDGRDVEFDTIPGVCGSVIPVDSLYFCYLYRSDNYLMVTDRDFQIKGYTARKGYGPNEVSQISFLYGNILNGVDIAVFDPDKRIVFGSNRDQWEELTPQLNLSDQYDVPAPLCLLELGSGKYLMAHWDYEYGLHTYDRADDSVDNWPLGIDLPGDKKYEISSGRGMVYSRSNDIVAEYYSVLPILILHGTDGDVLRVLQYADMPRWSDFNENSSSIIEDVCLTDNCIFTLLGGDNRYDDTDVVSSIVITDYNGITTGCLEIDRANTISIDEYCRRLIAVNPNADNNIRVYELPSWIVL